MKALARALLLVAVLGAPASAQDYPSREIHLVCAFVPGGGADIVARYLAEKLRGLAGRPVIVDNKPGMSGNFAQQYVAKQKPDGYTVYPVGANGLAASLSLFKTPPIDPLRDFQLSAGVLKQPWVLIVSADSPFKTLADLTAFLKQKGNKASYSTATTIGAVFGELYKSIAGLETVQVNYKTIGDSLNDLHSGAIDFMMADSGFALGQLKQGSVRALASSTATRMKSLPDIPTAAEGGVPGIDLQVWWAVALPAGVPQPIADKINDWFQQIVRMEETEKFLATQGIDPFIATPQETRALLEREIANWAAYVRLAKIEPQ